MLGLVFFIPRWPSGRAIRKSTFSPLDMRLYRHTYSVVITLCYLYAGCRILHFELDATFCETSSAAPETKRASQKTFCKCQ